MVSIAPGNTTVTLTTEQQSGTFTLQCDVQSTDTPSIHWTFTNTFASITRQLSNPAGSLYPSLYTVTPSGEQSSTLVINSLQFSDSGVYSCLASTSDASDDASTTLSILGEKQKTKINTLLYFLY